MISKQELVSVITANYNAEAFIQQAIDSVLAQQYEQWELLIVDDCSTDNSINIINTYVESDERIKLIKLEQNSGPAIARNRALAEAKGRYIAFLDSDDLWKEDKLVKQIAFMQAQNIPFSYTSYDLTNEDDEDKGEFLVNGKVDYYSLLKTCDIGCLTAIYDTSVLGKVDMPIILRRQDYGLWLRLLKKTPFAYALEDKLATYRLRKNSISSNKRKAAAYQWKIYREIEKLSLVKSSYHFVQYALNGLLKYK